MAAGISSGFLRVWLGLAAVLLACCLWPAPPAQAQTFHCTGAPGERMVGMTPGGNGLAPVPLCLRDGGAAAAPPPRALSFYAAIAWHPDAADVWIDGSYTQPGEAEGVALAACNRVMGGGCSTTGEWADSSMAIIRNAFGAFERVWLGQGNARRQQALDACTAKQFLPCEVFLTVNSRRDRYWPGPEVRKAYASGSWVEGRDGYDRKLYIASGRRSSGEAKSAALEACHTANPTRTCETVVETGNGFIQAGAFAEDNDFATVETTRDRARRAGEINCQRHKATRCRLQAMFDSREQGDFVHDFTQPGSSRAGR